MPDRPDFWSRRRRAVAAEEAASARRAVAEEDRAAAETLEDKSDAELLEMFGLPDPETLTPADAARFMAREIPARLRRRAIRSLFRNHPDLSVPDGLQDYDLDYTDAATRARPAQTVWAGARRSASEAARVVGGMVAPVEGAPEEISAAEPAAPAIGPADSPPEQEEDDAASPRPRRMVFRFEEPGR